MSDEVQQELTAEQVAKELQVNPRLVYKWIQTGELAAMDLGSGGKRVYRINRADLDDFKRRRRTKKQNTSITSSEALDRRQKTEEDGE
jgi:excisionase family DNA binding protein